jgi:hypothetical protein
MSVRSGKCDQAGQEKDYNSGSGEAVAVRRKFYTWLFLVMRPSRAQLATVLKHNSPFFSNASC